MNNIHPEFNQPPVGQMMPPQIGGPRPRGWRDRWMRQFGMSARMPRVKELTLPNWLSGKSIAFFFVSLFICWAVFGYVPDMSLWLVAAISVIVFFYGSSAMLKSCCNDGPKHFIRKVYIVGLVLRIIWVLYMYFFFNSDYFGNTYGDTADTDWYMNFAKDLAIWLKGESKLSLPEILDDNLSAIDDTAYPMWLAIGYVFWGESSDIFMPMMVKCIVNAYCAVCIYRVAKRHFGEGAARMAAIFVALNPNMIYWCGNMFKEAEFVFLCCVFIDKTDEALSSNKIGLASLWPGLLAGVSLFFFRAALGVSAFLALFAHIVFASNKVLSFNKKIVAGILVALTLFVSIGDSLRTKTETLFETAQSTEEQQKNMEWRSKLEAGNKFAKYAGAAVFAPLIFTIPFPTFNAAQEGQLLQIQLSGGYFIKNIFSFFVILVLLMMLISGEWRRHVFILAYTLAYHMVLVMSNFAQSGRFHMPVWPMILLFAAYGIQIAKTNGRIRKWFPIVLVLEIFICLAWNWFKLAGRGLV